LPRGNLEPGGRVSQKVDKVETGEKVVGLKVRGENQVYVLRKKRRLGIGSIAGEKKIRELHEERKRPVPRKRVKKKREWKK